MSEYHIPVLLEESIDGLDLQPDGIYVDVTYGGGGHSRRILERLQGGKLVAFDQDEDARQNLIDDDRLIFVSHNFKFLKNFLRYHGIGQVDGILADLGVSSHDFDQPDRGFSFRFDGNLDMRMNQSAEKDAVKVINEYDVSKLGEIFREYGEIQNWRNLAQTIEQARSTQKIVTITQFLNAISRCVPAKIEKKYLAQVSVPPRPVAIIATASICHSDIITPNKNDSFCVMLRIGRFSSTIASKGSSKNGDNILPLN